MINKIVILSVVVLVSGCATSENIKTRNIEKTKAYAHVDSVKAPGCDTFSSASHDTAYAPLKRVHVVKAGETLWSISKSYGIDVISFAKANSIVDSRRIEIGQELIIPDRKYFSKSVKSRPSSGKINFIWPVKGNIVSAFGAKIDNNINKGIDIRSSDGAEVIASRGGKVVFCDSHLKGFGQTVIIDHMDGFQTVYAYNSEILVKVGDIVAQRNVIARVGSTGRAKTPTLHFEIRKNGEPKNPVIYLSR